MVRQMVTLAARLMCGVGAFLLIFFTLTCLYSYPYRDMGNVELSIARIVIPSLMVGALAECLLLALLRHYQLIANIVARLGWFTMGIILAIDGWLYFKIQ